MFSNIKLDLNRVSNTSSRFGKIKVIIISHSFHLVLFYRLSTFFYRKVPYIGNMISIILEYFIRIVFSSDISRKSRIGPGLIFLHGTDIVIGSEVVIGKNCKILNGVTLGNQDTEKSYNEHPVLGDNIVIGTGAKLLGKIKLGNNIRIGANSVVICNFDSNAIIAGIPAKKISDL